MDGPRPFCTLDPLLAPWKGHPMATTRKVGAAVRRRRHELELTQEAVAERAGIAQETVSYVERTGKASADTRRKIAHALRCRQRDLWPPEVAAVAS